MKVLFFSPHAAIWPHAFPEALLAETLMQRGHAVYYVTCGGCLASYCVPMSAFRLTHESPANAKQRICAMCHTQRDVLREKFKLAGSDLERSLDEAGHREIAARMAALTPGNLLELVIDGVPVGRAALYEYCLNNKKSSLDFLAPEWNRVQSEVRNALLAFHAGRAILDREKPDRMVTYGSLYSVSRVVRDLARARGIPVYNLHAGLTHSRRLQRLLCYQDDTFRAYVHYKNVWPQYRDVPCSREMLSFVVDHFLAVFGARSVFSYQAARRHDAPSARQQFGVDEKQKLVVAVLSSYDELFGAEISGAVPTRRMVFATQAEWVKALADWFRTRPDLFLVVRVHPRELPNKRDSVTSDHARQLAASLVDLPPNVRVNWPAERVAIWDLADQADLFLNGWSSAGKEMALLGLPVLSATDTHRLYPDDLNEVADSTDEYFAKLAQCLTMEWSLERSRRTFRWYALEFCRAALDIEEAFDWREPTTFFEKVWSRAQRELALGWVRRRECDRRPPVLREQERLCTVIERGVVSALDVAPAGAPPPPSLEEETASLRAELARLTLGLYGNLEPAPGSRLKRHLLAAIAGGAR